MTTLVDRRLSLAIVLVVAACASPTPDRTAPPTPGVSPLPTPAGSPTTNPTEPPIVVIPEPLPGACPLDQLPGAADAPPYGSSEMDFSDLGAGRWRLCTNGVVLEASAWCEWDQQRTQILGINGLPERGAAQTYDAWLSFVEGIQPIRSAGWRVAARVELAVTYHHRGGSIATYAGRPELHAGTIDADGLGGALAFTVEIQTDPESEPMAEVPDGYEGIIRWRCSDRPPA